MAVRVGLYYRPHPGIRRGLAQAVQVVTQGLGMDKGINRAGHSPTLTAGAVVVRACYNPCTVIFDLRTTPLPEAAYPTPTA